jgi:hypothetical protein
MNEDTEQRAKGGGQDGAGGARGWLLLLSLTLMLWQPVSLGLSASSALEAVAVRGWPLMAVIAIRVVVAGLGISAGLAIIGRHPGAIAMAKTSLALSAATDVFVYVTPYFPNNRLPGETPFYVAASLAYYSAWMIYLVKLSTSPPCP